MDKYLMFTEKALSLKEDIENMIAEGKRKGYIFKEYRNRQLRGSIFRYFG